MGFGIAFAVATFVIANLFLGLSLMASFICIVLVLLCLSPIILRLSRNIWINLFLNYKKTNQ